MKSFLDSKIDNFNSSFVVRASLVALFNSPDKNGVLIMLNLFKFKKTHNFNLKKMILTW